MDDSGPAEWVTEGIQIGEATSGMGVLGMWTGAQHERMDPLGAIPHPVDPICGSLIILVRSVLGMESRLVNLYTTSEHIYRDFWTAYFTAIYFSLAQGT